MLVAAGVLNISSLSLSIYPSIYLSIYLLFSSFLGLFTSLNPTIRQYSVSMSAVLHRVYLTCLESTHAVLAVVIFQVILPSFPPAYPSSRDEALCAVNGIQMCNDPHFDFPTSGVVSPPVVSRCNEHSSSSHLSHTP